MIIIRKSRNENWYMHMQYHLTVAESYYAKASRSTNDAEKWHLIFEGKWHAKCAAKAGGFFRVEDMYKYLDQQKPKTERSA